MTKLMCKRSALLLLFTLFTLFLSGVPQARPSTPAVDGAEQQTLAMLEHTAEIIQEGNKALEAVRFDPLASSATFQRLSQLQVALHQKRDELEAQIKNIEQNLNVLDQAQTTPDTAPAPDEAAPQTDAVAPSDPSTLLPQAANKPESAVDAIAGQRQLFVDQLAERRAALASIELNSREVALLLAEITARKRAHVYSTKTARQTDTLTLTDINQSLNYLLSGLAEFGQKLSQDVVNNVIERALVNPWEMIKAFAWCIPVIVIGYYLRRVLVRNWGRRRHIANPTLRQRIVAALLHAIGDSLIPVVTLTTLATLLTPELISDTEHPLFICAVTFVLLIAILIPFRAIFSPKNPQWALLVLPSTRAAGVVLGFTLLVLNNILSQVFIKHYLQQQHPALPTVSDTLDALEILIDCIGLFLIIQNALTDKFWRWYRRLSGGLLLGAAVLDVIGYVTAASTIIQTITIALLYGTLLWHIASLFSDAINWMRHGLQQSGYLSKKGSTRLAIVLKWCIFTALSLFWATVLLLNIGLPFEDLQHFTSIIIGDFSIGSIRISIGAIALGIGVFFVIMAITKLIQKLLLNTLLPALEVNPGVRHSISASIGYVGVIASIGISIAAVGVNLQSVALLAGALSVGIGFGLQNIVSNFVSGIILNFERPIRVGDWITVSGYAGYVSRIDFRATELSTPNRESVLIPNSVMLSTPVVNQTYADQNSRAELLISVGYDSDTQAVIDILVEEAQAHPTVMRHPEPTAYLMNFGADGLDFSLRFFLHDWSFCVAALSDIRQSVLKRLREQNIDIPYPQRVLHINKSLEK